jgi:hypothetical protein
MQYALLFASIPAWTRFRTHASLLGVNRDRPAGGVAAKQCRLVAAVCAPLVNV